MENQSLKMKIIRSALQRHYDVMDKYQNRIRRLRNLEPAGERKKSSSGTNNALEMTRLLHDHLLFINEEMNVLYTMAKSNFQNSEVKPGSVVVTDNGIFFISVFVDSFSQDGNDISCVSENCPFYFQMRGKRSGEQFIYDNTKYKILEIY